MLTLIVLLILMIWGAYLYYLLDKSIFIDLEFYKTLTNEEKEKFKYYLRTDINNFNKPKLFIKGFFFIPLRAFGYFFLLFLNYLILKVLCIYYNISDFEKEYPQNFQNIIRKITNYLMKINNKYCINLNVTYKLIKSENPTPEHERNKCKLIVSNHTSWLDSRYFIQFKPLPSILMDEFFKNKPFIGFFSKINQNIFIKNHENNKEDRKEVIKKLNERADDFKKNKNYSPLLIFPEGMTTNSNLILPYRKGIFSLNLPVRVMCLDYRDNEIIPEMTMFDFLGSFLLPFMNFRNNLTVYEFDKLLYPKDFLDSNKQIDSLKMANECRKMVKNALNLEYLPIHNIYKLNSEFFKLKKRRIIEIRQKRKFHFF